MSIVAFTNSVGKHWSKRTNVDHAVGVRYGVPVNIHRNVTVDDGFSDKSPPVHGDRHSPTPYYRFINSLIRDEPYVVRRLDYFNGQLVVDTLETTHMSGEFPVLNMSPPDSWGEDFGNIRSQAITQALNKMRKGKVGVGNNAGEAGQVVRMITDNTRKVVGAYNSLRRGNFALALKHLGLNPKAVFGGRTLAQRWLELQYGWKPLISDIHDGTKLLCDYVDPGKPVSMNVKVVKNQKVERDFGLVHAYRFDTRWKCVGTAKCGLFAKVSCPALVGADMFGLLNPLSIAWELTPFSFIVDWFVPVGNVLDALSATAGLDFGTGFITTVEEQRFSASLRAFDAGRVENGGDFLVGNYLMRRQVLPDFPLPELYAKENPFSKAHVYNAIALIRGMHK